MQKRLSDVEVAVIEAQEDLVIDMQFMLQDVLVKKKISRAELSRRTGIGVRKLSNMMAAGANPTLKEVALIFTALDKKVVISARRKARA